MKEIKDFESLNDKQIQALPLLAAGLTDQEVADVVDVSRQTVNMWKNHNLVFRDYLNYERAQLLQSYMDRASALVPKALKVLEESLESEDPKVSLDVAKNILKALGVLNPIRQVGHPNMGKLSERANQISDSVY